MNTAIALLSAALSFEPGGCHATRQEQNNQGQPIDHVDVTQVTGTIQKVDPDKRKLVIHLDNGKTKSLKVDKSVKNLDQFKPGDKVQVSYTEEIVMMADKSQKGTAAAARYGLVGVSPEGEKPAIVQVDTTEIAGKILSIDPNRRRITVEDPDGKNRTLRLSKRVKNLEQFKPGDNLNMAVTEETAIEVVG